VDQVGGVADQRQPAVDIALGMLQGERVGPAAAAQREPPERLAEAAHQRAGEGGVGERQHGRRQPGALRPHQRGAVALLVVGHRQQGEGPRGQEMLVRHPAMRRLVPDGGDQRGLRIGPARDADAGGLAQRRVLAVGGDQQRRAQPAAVGQRHRYARRVGLGRPRDPAGPQGHAGERRDAGEQGAPDHPVLDDVAEGRCRGFGRGQRAMVVMQEEGRGAAARPPVGDADIEDRLGLGRHVRPGARPLQQVARAMGDRRGPPVMGRIEPRRCGGRLDHRHRDAGAAQRGGERQPDHAAAGDQHLAIEGSRHGGGGSPARLPLSRAADMMHEIGN
jgi:hypothetical protein